MAPHDRKSSGNKDEKGFAPDPRSLFINYEGNRWDLYTIIAKGGFSTVYEAKSKDENYPLACKVAI